MLDTAHSSGDGRIVFVSSMAHYSGEFVPENMNAERSYSRVKFYCHSKLYNVSVSSCEKKLVLHIQWVQLYFIDFQHIVFMCIHELKVANLP